MSGCLKVAGGAETTTAAAVAEAAAEAEAAAAGASGGGAGSDMILNVVLKNSVERTYLNVIRALGNERRERLIVPFYFEQFPEREADLLAFKIRKDRWAAAIFMPYNSLTYRALREAWRRGWRADRGVQHLDDVGEFEVPPPDRRRCMYFALHNDHFYATSTEYGVDYIVSAVRFYMAHLERLVRMNSSAPRTR